MRLDTVGFCGVDDTVDLEELRKISAARPWIEWGVLLRPDRQGQPRYAGQKVLESLGRLAHGGELRLAAHFCGDDCLKALNGDVKHVRSRHETTGCSRVQFNPTAANAASGWEPQQAAENLRAVAAALPELEFILQVNEETQELAKRLFEDTAAAAPPNFAMLMDASCGLGVAPGAHPAPLPGVHCGFAGGMGPDTVVDQLGKVAQACRDCASTVWIDMETGVRSQSAEGGDIFDLARVRKVVATIEATDYLAEPKEARGQKRSREAGEEPQ